MKTRLIRRKMEEKAYDFLIRAGITELPFNAFELSKGLSCVLYTYDQIVKYSRKHHFTYKRLIGCFGHAYAYFDKENNVYILTIDTHCDSKTLYMAICHEVGHIENGHLLDGAIRFKGTRNFESEMQAQIFAEDIMCPILILEHTDTRDSVSIAELCMAPEDVGNIKEKELRDRYLIDPFWIEKIRNIENKLINQFKNFIADVRNRTDMSPELFPYDELVELKKRIS